MTIPLSPPATEPDPPDFAVCVMQTGENFQCKSGESLLRGMLRLGRRGIPAGCASGGCGVCKVRIVQGSVGRIGPISRAHVSSEQEAQGWTLACRVASLSAVWLEVAARLHKPFLLGRQ